MKKYILCLISIIFFIPLMHSQKYCETYKWNWWDDFSYENWQFRSQDGIKDAGIPWSANHDLVNIYNSKDYLPEKGWVLLYKSFGCNGTIRQFPSFYLYNRYTGKLRVFFYLNTGNTLLQNGGIINMKWFNNTNTNALLTHTSPISKPINYYQTGITNNDNGNAALLKNNYISGNWVCADFEMAFDNRDLSSFSTAPSLEYYLEGVTEFKLNVAGDLRYITENYNPKVDNTTISTPNSDARQLLVNGKGLLTKFPSEADLNKVFKEKETDLATFESKSTVTISNIKAVETYKSTLTELNGSSKFGDFLKGVSKVALGMSKVFDVGLGVFDLFMSKPSTGPTEVVIHPTVSTGTVKLTGTITTSKINDYETFQLPGSNHSGVLTSPVWDCPLGVIGLEKKPALSINTGYIRKVTMFDDTRYTIVNPNDRLDKPGSITDLNNCTGTEFTGIDRSQGVVVLPVDISSSVPNWHPATWGTIIMKSIRIDEDLKLALNSKAGMEVVDIKAALVGKVRGGDRIYNTTVDKDHQEGSIGQDGILDYPRMDLGFKPTTLPDAYKDLPVIASRSICIYNKPDQTKNVCVSGVVLESQRELYKNNLVEMINDGFYNLTSVDKWGLYEYSTPLIDVKNFKNTTINVPDFTDVYLQIVAVLKPTDPAADQTPFVWSVKYLIDDSPEKPTAAYYSPGPPLYIDHPFNPYPFTRAQIKDVNPEGNSMNLYTINNRTISKSPSTYYKIETSGNVTVNLAQNVDLTAYQQISLKPGFSASSQSGTSFNAKIVNNNSIIESNYTSLNSIVTPYFESCNCDEDYFSKVSSLKNAFEFDNNKKDELMSGNKIFDCEMSPNPVINILKIKANNKIANGKVINMMGKVVLMFDNIDNTETTLNLEHLTNGIYFIILNSNDQTTTKKIIKI